MSDYPTGSTNPFGAPPSESVEYLRVGFGPRLLAYIIDILLTLIFASGLAVLFLQFDLSMTQIMSEQLNAITDMYELLGISESLTQMVVEFIPAMTLGGMIGGIMYALIEGLTGASPGKRILKIAIAHQDARAGDQSMWLRRFAIKNINTILQFFMLVPSLAFIDTIGDLFGLVIFFGCFMVLGQSRLALHDRIAQTAVYYREDIR